MDSFKVLITIFTSIDAFFITKNIFTSSNMDLYCQNHCNSRSGTIYSDEEFSEVKKVIQNTPNYWGKKNTPNIWIGLTASPFPKFEWSDHTSLFDTSFGNNIAGGVYPWLVKQPNGNGQQCVILKASADYLWSDVGKCESMQRSLCNDCNSVLNKYIISTDMSLSPHLECESKFGTSLANVHTQRDYQEAKTLCEIYGESCWISNQNNTDKDCSELDKGSNFTLNNVDCNNNSIHYTLCDLPSELCDLLSKWTILGDDITGTDCEIDVFGGNAVMRDTQWYNSNGIVLIDYMFSIDFKATIGYGETGIVIYENICDFYYISIDGYNISISYQNADQQYKLVTVPLQVHVNDTELLLSIRITNKTLFDISVNDIHHILYAHSINKRVSNTYYSGYIGIKSSLLTYSKALYVSGTMYKMAPNAMLNTSGQCTTTETSTETSEIGLTGQPDNPFGAVIRETIYYTTTFNNGSPVNTTHLFSINLYVAGAFTVCGLLCCTVILMFLCKKWLYQKKLIQSVQEMAISEKIGAQSATSPAFSTTQSPTKSSVTATSVEICKEENDTMQHDLVIKVQDEDFMFKTLETIGEINPSNVKSISDTTGAFDSDKTIYKSKTVEQEDDSKNVQYSKRSNSDHLIKQQQVIKSFEMNKDLADQFNALSNRLNSFTD